MGNFYIETLSTYLLIYICFAILRAAILDFILTSCLFFKTIVRNAFLTPKYPRIEVLHMIVATHGQLLHRDSFSLFAHLHHALAFNMFIKKLPKVTKAATKLNLTIYPLRINYYYEYTFMRTHWHKMSKLPFCYAN